MWLNEVLQELCWLQAIHESRGSFFWNSCTFSPASSLSLWPCHILRHVTFFKDAPVTFLAHASYSSTHMPKKTFLSLRLRLNLKSPTADEGKPDCSITHISLKISSRLLCSSGNTLWCQDWSILSIFVDIKQSWWRFCSASWETERCQQRAESLTPAHTLSLCGIMQNWWIRSII